MTPTLSELDTIENASTHGNRSVGSRSSPTSPYSDVSGTTVASSAAPPKRFPGDLSQDRLRQLNESDETLDRGWPLLAKLLAKEPEFEAFPRFHEENIKNLLYYQIEIECLSHKLREQEREDSTEVGVEREFAKCPDKMIGIVSRKRSPGCEQWELVQKLRKCLYDYNAALLQYAEMSKLPEPNSRNMSAFVKWLMSPSGGNFPIGGRGSQVWGPLGTIDQDPSLKELFQRLLRGIVSILTFWRWKTTRTRQDLVAPRQGRKVDALTRWVVYDAFPWCDEVWKHLNRKKRKDRRSISGAKDEEKSADNARVGYVEGGKQERPPETEEEQKRRTKAIAPFSEKAVNRVTSAVATIAACMLPTGGIALLTTVETTMQKLLYIGGFTLLFSLGLMLLTSEISRVQIFTATAAFSAVLVVFVQT